MLTAIRGRAALVLASTKTWALRHKKPLHVATYVTGFALAAITEKYGGGFYPLVPYAVIEEVDSHALSVHVASLYTPFSEDAVRLFIEERRADVHRLANNPEKIQIKATVWKSAFCYYGQCILGLDTRNTVIVGRCLDDDTYEEFMSCVPKTYAMFKDSQVPQSSSTPVRYGDWSCNTHE